MKRCKANMLFALNLTFTIHSERVNHVASYCSNSVIKSLFFALEGHLIPLTASSALNSFTFKVEKSVGSLNSSMSLSPFSVLIPTLPQLLNVHLVHQMLQTAYCNSGKNVEISLHSFMVDDVKCIKPDIVLSMHGLRK